MCGLFLLSLSICCWGPALYVPSSRAGRVRCSWKRYFPSPSLSSEPFGTVVPLAAIQGPGCGSKLPLNPAARTKTVRAKHGPGTAIFASISAFPSPESGIGSVVATTVPPAPPQTRLALTLVTGPGFPRFGKIKSRNVTCNLPSSFSTTEPRSTVQGAPPLCTPAIIVLGLDPMMEDRNSESCAITVDVDIPQIVSPTRATLPRALLIIRRTLPFCRNFDLNKIEGTAVAQNSLMRSEIPILTWRD